MQGAYCRKGASLFPGSLLSYIFCFFSIVDQLVERDLISRREDEHDRRMKRVTNTENGRKLILVLEQRRAEAQIAVMEYLSGIPLH